MVSNINGLEIRRLENYLLDKDELIFFRSDGDNSGGFIEDFSLTKLRRYEGDCVVYCRGFLCGHTEGSDSLRRLFDTAVQTYGKEENIMAIIVPYDNQSLEEAINRALKHDKIV